MIFLKEYNILGLIQYFNVCNTSDYIYEFGNQGE